MRLSIRYKLLSGFALLLGLSSLIYTLSFKITRDYVYYQVGSLQIEKAQSATERIQDFIAQIELHHLGFAKQFLDQYQNDSSSFINTVQYVIRTERYFKKTTFLTTVGRKIAEIDYDGKLNPDTFEFEIPTSQFDEAVSGKTAISKVYFPAVNSGPQIDIFSPILANDKSVAGVIKSQIDLTEVWDLISKVKIGKSGFAYVVDDEGRVIAHPDQRLVLAGTNVTSRSIITNLINNTTDAMKPEDELYINEQGTQVIAKGLKLPRINWSVIIEQPVSEASSFLDFNRNLFYLTLTGSIILLIIISLFLSENLTRPMRKLQSFANSLKQGSLKSRVNVKSGDEIEDLGNSFNLMADQLQQREKSLQSEKQQMETLLQYLNDGVIAVGTNNEILLFNKAAEVITELSSEEVIGKNVDEALRFYRNEDVIPFARYQIQSEKIISKLKQKGVHFITKTGKRKVVSMHAAPVVFEYSDQNGWLVTIHDITEEQELEEMKLDFVAMAAHELRTPLTAIRGYLDILSEEAATSLTNEHKLFLQRIVIGAKQLSTLVENLLNVSRIEQGNLKLELHPILMEDIIDSNLTNLSELAIQRGIQLEFTKPEKPTPHVLADRFRVGEVVTNLVSNGISYTQMGGWVKVTLEDHDDEVIVHVSDNGQGIPGEALTHLFTKFYRVSGKLEQGSKGTGLGLFISKAIVDAHGGRIWVESTLGQGTTFSFSVPKVNLDNLPAPQSGPKNSNG